MPKKKPNLQITFGPDVVFEVGKVVEVDIKKKVIYIEEMADGTYRITYSKQLLSEPALLKLLRIEKT